MQVCKHGRRHYCCVPNGKISLILQNPCFINCFLYPVFFPTLMPTDISLLLMPLNSQFVYCGRDGLYLVASKIVETVSEWEACKELSCCVSAVGLILLVMLSEDREGKTHSKHAAFFFKYSDLTVSSKSVVTFTFCKLPRRQYLLFSHAICIS